MNHNITFSGVGCRARRAVGRRSLALAILILAPLLLGCADNGPSTFATPEQATDAFVNALRAGDSSRVKQILGPEGHELVYSGDKVADRRAVFKFLNAYDERHTLESDAQGRRTLQVGPDDWPLPIPIVQQRGKWAFDAESGKDEILNRRIGRNELSAVQVCLAIVDAQREYAMQDVDRDGIPEYAQQILSDEGKRNGLYWEPQPGEPESPLGPLIAGAAAEGYTSATTPTGDPAPYHGYRYRILTAQGPAARGGECDYVVHGKMIGGFGVVAFPADHGNSGIMTFIVNHDGVVYQKDLGPETKKIGQAMSSIDPGEGWQPVEPLDPPDSP